MKSNVKYDIEHEGTLGSNRVEMRFSNDKAGRAHLMSLLTDAYSDRETSTLREVACNGWDAQVEAGYDGPLEVTLPTSMMPYLVIQDHGTGMSVDFVENEFIEYGTSTKRGTDAQTGFLGIGGKSPLTLTAQFTFTTVRNGVKATVEVSRGPDGVGGIEVTDTAATDEPNGTRFKIPIENILSMIRKAEKFFRFWPKGTVLLDGHEPERPTPVMVLDPDIKIYQVSDSRYLGAQDIVVMGGVPYPVTDEYRLSGPLRNDQYVVADIPMGSVNFVPSREALDYDTDLTRDTLNTIREFVKERALEEVQADIDSKVDPIEGALLANKYNRQMKSGDGFKWRGHEIPDNLYMSLQVKPWHTNDIDWDGGISYRYTPDGGHPKGQRIDWGRKVNLTSLKNAWVIEGFPNKSLSLNNQTKIDRWMQAVGISPTVNIFLLPEEGLARPWVPMNRTAHWDDVKKFRAPRKDGAGDYRVFSKQLKPNRHRSTFSHFPHSVRIDEVPAKGRLVYYSSTDQGDYHTRGRHGYVTDKIGPVLAHAFPDVYVFHLPKNRWAKFKRENRRAKHVKEFLNNELRKFQKKLTNEQAFILSGVHFSIFDRIDQMVFRSMAKRASEIVDPDVEKVLHALVSPTKEQRDLWGKIAELFRAIGYTATLEFDQSAIIKNMQMILDRYSVITCFDNATDAIEYINALYFYRKEE